MRLDYRPIPDSDIDAYLDLMCDESLAVNAGSVPYPVDRDWVLQRLITSRQKEIDGFRTDRGLYEEGVLVGMFSYFFQGHGLEIGYSIHRNHRGRGLATKSAKLAVKLARDHRKTGPISANYFKDNPASGRVLEKVGFQRTGEELGQSMGRPGDIPAWCMRLENDVALSVAVNFDDTLLCRLHNDECSVRHKVECQSFDTAKAFHAYRLSLQTEGTIFRTLLLEGVAVGYMIGHVGCSVSDISYCIGESYFEPDMVEKALNLWRAEFPGTNV